MQLNISLLCSVVCLLLLCFAPVCPSKHSKRRHAQIHQRTHGTKKFCDPSFSNQTAGAITQSTVQLSVSVQKCSSGFYREQTGPHRGQCVPCSCNGLSNECDERTGNCVNCQSNTVGDHCERCKEGHYGNAANRTCRACPCPLTGNNFALACLDIGSAVECLCKRGYIGPRCERCAFGYYGNPMMDGGSCKPCKCKEGAVNFCNSLTGECITSGNSSSGGQCHDCDICVVTLLFDLEKMDDVLARMKQQLQNFTHESASVSGLNRLQANVSDTKIAVGGYSSAVRHLDAKVEQLEADMDAVGDDFSRLIDETREGVSYLENVFQDVNGTKLKAEDLLSEAEALLREIHDLIKRRAEAKPAESLTLSDDTKARTMEEAQRIVQEMRARGCSAQRGDAGREQEEANTMLDIIRNLTAPVQTHQTVLNETADSLLDSSLREMAELLSDAEDKVDRTRGLNLRSRTVLQQLERLHARLEREQSALPPVAEMTKDVLKNITEMILMLEEIKKEFEIHAARLNGAKPELMKLNVLQIMKKVDIVTKAEEHAEELNRTAAEFQQLLHDALNGTHLHIGTYNNILNAIENADMAANESKEAADRALKDVKDGDLENRAEGLKDNSAQLKANETQNDLKTLSRTVNMQEHRVEKQKEKRESLRTDISAFSRDIKQIRRDDTRVLIESVKSAASASNSTVRNITERLSNISQEVDRVTLTNVSVNRLIDADRAVKNLTAALLTLQDKITQVEALRGSKPGGDLTDVIWMIKDVIEEARTYVNRVPVATIFNGKGHVELRPPRNFEDLKAFSAVELFLNRHQNNPTKADKRRKRRQDKHRDANFFVFYLGNRNASGDYIGMAIRNNVLICVYKLGGDVHEVKTSPITTTTNVNSPNIDVVHFFRVYQDAQVDIIRSDGPLVKRLLSKSSYSVLEVDPDSVVFYVGGYPKNFTPPVELRYNKYRGAMRMTSVNGNPVCLFNYKRAENMNPKQPSVMVRRGLEASDYYDGTGYRMAFTKEPHEIRRRLYKFDLKSREPNALLFFIGTEETFFCVFVERGFLVLQGQQAGRKMRVQSPDKVSLYDQRIAIAIADTFIVLCGRTKLSADHVPTNYTSYYIGGLPALLRQRHNVTAPPLRGCVSHLTEDAEFVILYNKTIAVTHGCPSLALSVRSATLHSPLPVDSLIDRGEQTLRVSVGFRSTDTHGVFLRSSSQGSSVHDLQLSLADGYAVFNSDNYVVRSDKRYNDGSWHYLSALRRPTGLELSIDNVKVSQGQSSDSRSLDRGNFTGCITNIYTRRPHQQLLPADLSLLSPTEGVVLGRCSLHPPSQTEVSPTKKPPKHEPLQAPAGSQCKRRQAQYGGYQLSGEHSWLSYNLPQWDLNYRPHFTLDIKTNSSKGLILHVAGRGVVPLLALYLANGRIRMSLGENRIIQHKQKSNDGNWHRVQLSVEKSSFHLLVDGLRVTDGQLPDDAGSSLNFHNPVYLGADPMSKTTKGHNVPVNSVVGCIRDFKLYDEDVGEPEASQVTLPCFDRFTEMGTFFSGGHIVLDDYFTIGSQFELAFELRPQYLTGLLFHAQNHKISLEVFLKETEVGVEMNVGTGPVRVSVTPPESLCDGKFHTITVSKRSELITLEVDSVFERRTLPSTWHTTELNSLHIGGTTNQNRVSVSSPFVGCLRNVNLNGRPVVFETGYRRFGSVDINRCPAD